MGGVDIDAEDGASRGAPRELLPLGAAVEENTSSTCIGGGE